MRHNLGLWQLWFLQEKLRCVSWQPFLMLLLLLQIVPHIFIYLVHLPLLCTMLSFAITTRGKNSKVDKECQLCLLFLHVSHDPIIGNGQKKVKFWERITSHLNNHRPARVDEPRLLSSLESKWSSINYEVSWSTMTYKNIVFLNQLGTLSKDTLEKAKEIFKAKHPKGKMFAFLTCWDVLKEVPKWQESGPLFSKKTKKANSMKTKLSLIDVTNNQSPHDANSPSLPSSERLTTLWIQEAPRQ